jgi:antitoxin (DNA-binding transcriptional repressor) of toxin-antitoxin stability system
MKTASVRDLRNHFADVAKWIESGELVSITRHGSVFATLSPAAPKKRLTADWKARFKDHPPLGRGISIRKTSEIWSDLRD